jgi:hypothetical protein
MRLLEIHTQIKKSFDIDVPIEYLSIKSIALQ